MRVPVALGLAVASLASSHPANRNATSKVTDPTPDAPRNVHLALGHDAGHMVVSWATTGGGEGAVRFGATASANGETQDNWNVLDSKCVVEGAQYTMQAIPRNTPSFVTYTSDYIFHCTLTDLKPDVEYTYVINEDEGTRGTFRTVPAVGADDDSSFFSFIAMGDLGQTADSAKTVAFAAQDEDARFVLHAGDMSYADCEMRRWDTWFDVIAPLSKRLPWMVSAGNHEIEPNNLTGHIMDPYKHLFRMPQSAPGVDTTQHFQNPANSGLDCTPSALTGSYDFGNSFYSFAVGAATVLVLNSYSGTNADSAQYAWVQETLSGIDRKQTPWVFAAWHSPWYNSNDDHLSEFNTVRMRDSMEGLLLDGGVNVVFSGHVHAYERSSPVAFNKTDDAGITYIKIGDGGNREGHASTYIREIPDWSAYRNGTSFGHGKVTLANRTHARWQWISNDAKGRNLWGTEDAVWIRNVHA